MTTEVGKIAGMINSTEKQETPLQQKLDKLGKTLGIAALVICAVIFILGILQGKEMLCKERSVLAEHFYWLGLGSFIIVSP